MKRLGAKVILRCQNMFYNSGEVLGIFFPLGGGGSPIPKSICQNGYQKVNIFMKTKNAPKDLKCKINHTFFFWKQGFPKGGEGGGSDIWEKFPKLPVWVASFITVM